MAKKKAKWLEESTNQELISEVMEKVLLGDEIEKKDTTRAVKALEELQERLPNEGEEVSLEEALSDMEKALLEGIQKARDAYNSELEAITEEEDDEDEEEDIEDSDEDSDEDDDDEDIEDEDIEETDEEGYEDLTVKELRAECRKRGIPVKGLKKPGMIEALQGLDEDDDEDIEDEDIEETEDIEDIEEEDIEEEEEEETDEDEEDMDYEELSTRALKELMKDRGIKVKKGMKKQELIKALEADDQE